MTTEQYICPDNGIVDTLPISGIYKVRYAGCKICDRSKLGKPSVVIAYYEILNGAFEGKGLEQLFTLNEYGTLALQGMIGSSLGVDTSIFSVEQMLNMVKNQEAIDGIWLIDYTAKKEYRGFHTFYHYVLPDCFRPQTQVKKTLPPEPVLPVHPPVPFDDEIPF